MSQREMTFYPEGERTQDLIYSEYTSCDRSIHCLLQDGRPEQQRFLLSAYREIVSRYLSGARLLSPVAFLKDVITRLEDLSKPFSFTMEDYRSMGFHVLLRDTGRYYVLTTQREAVFIHDDGDFSPLSEAGVAGVERIVLESTQLQEELFPDKLGDCFALYALDPQEHADHDIILGCRGDDRSTVAEVLGDPLWMQTGDRRNTFSSRFIKRKVLVLRFEDEAPIRPVRRVSLPRRGSWRRTAGVLAAGAAVITIAVALVKMETLMPWGSAERGTAMMEMPVESEGELRLAETHPVDESGAIGEMEPAPGVAESALINTKLTEAWKRSFKNPVTSSPVLHGDRVFFGCRDGNLYALEKNAGSTLWQVPASGGVGASPIVHDGAVIAADYGGNVFAVGVADGKRAWKTKLPDRVVSSPVVSADRVLVGCYDGAAYCLSRQTGRILWKHGTGAKIRATPAVASEVFIVASYDGSVYALDKESGTTRWKFRIGGNIAGSPVVEGETVVVGGPDGVVYALDVADGQVEWKYRTGGAVKSTPAVADGLVFVGSNDNYVYCLRAEDGSLAWKYATGGVVLTRPVVRGGLVYAGSYDGFLYCLSVEDGALVDRFQSNGEIYSSPAADENGVYFGNNKGRFIALEHTVKDAS